jgi:hypothetical protein
MIPEDGIGIMDRGFVSGCSQSDKYLICGADQEQHAHRIKSQLVSGYMVL